MRILLIRHGVVELMGRVLYSRMPGVHLSEEGTRQAQALANALQERFRITEIVASPLERALETARPIAETQGLGVRIDEAFIEVDAGSWMGKPFDELYASEEWKTYNEHRSLACPPGGEFIIDVQTRAWLGVRNILRRYNTADDTTVAVVSHGDVIRGLLILLLGMPVDHIHRLEVAPASVSEISVGNGQPRVLAINQLF